MPMKVARYLNYYTAIVLVLSSAGNLPAEPATNQSQPAPIVKAWGILFQVMERFEEYVAKKKH